MRWDIIKQAWQLARDSFPKVERIYVSFPDRFRNSGECDILDLERPRELLGKIGYRFACYDQEPIVLLSLDKAEKSVKLPRQAALEIKTEIVPPTKVSSICAEDIMEKYGDMQVLGEQLAYLCVGHEDGPLYHSNLESINEAVLSDWIRKTGFPPSVLSYIAKKLETLGVTIVPNDTFNLRTAKKKKRKFPDFAKVRIIDPQILAEGRGGQIVGYKPGKDEQWYAVIIDGASAPVMFNEKQLAENTVGRLKGISAFPQAPHPNTGPEVQP